jgi:hypothetical protein
MNRYRSDDIDLIMGSLAKAQGSYKQLIPNEQAAGGMFANLHAILNAVKDALSTNGISFYQNIELLDEGSGAALLWTQLAHASGQYISSCTRIIQGATFKETFNMVEAYRRVNAMLLLGIAPSGKDPLLYDDNGASQAEKVHLKNSKALKNPDKPHVTEPVSSEEYQELIWELEGFPEIAQNLQEFYDIKTLADLPRSEYYNAKAKIRKIKKVHEDYVKNN